MTYNILAQAGPSGHETWVVLGGVAVLASILGNWAQWQMSRRKHESRRIEPQPLEVKQVHEFVRKDECAALHEQNRKRVVELAEMLEAARRLVAAETEKAGFSRKAIYTEIKTTNDQTRNHIEEVRKELSEKIDGMPDRVIAILRNFGVIGK